ncbi:MAG TPA: hypothetical protein VD902_13135 [Symbiobacteriaceae bacterium]|nr:hypothetical protein [Symbiobacteriaceae bacterium]
MAHDIWARAQAKWRGILVFALLQLSMRVATAFILAAEPAPGIRIYANLANAALGIYCLLSIWRLIMSDQEGDEAWPQLWS